MSHFMTTPRKDAKFQNLPLQMRLSHTAGEILMAEDIFGQIRDLLKSARENTNQTLQTLLKKEESTDENSGERKISTDSCGYSSVLGIVTPEKASKGSGIFAGSPRVVPRRKTPKKSEGSIRSSTPSGISTPPSFVGQEWQRPRGQPL